MNLATFFEDITASFGPRTALKMRLRYRSLRWSYRELGEKARALERALYRHNVQPGDRVLLYSPNSPYWVAAFFAILSRGAVVVPLNPQSPLEQLERISAKVQPILLVKSRRLPSGIANLPTLEIESAAEEKAGGAAAPLPPKPQIPDDSLAEIIFTSGTTGNPKGVMLTHRNLFSTIQTVEKVVPVKSSDHVLNIIPLFHIYAQLIGMICPLGKGMRLTYIPSLGTRAIRQALAGKDITHIVAVPEFLKTVMGRLEEKIKIPKVLWLPFFVRRILFTPVRRRISKKLHSIASGGAPLDPALEKKWRNLGFYVLQGYGLTETSAVATMNTYREHRYGSVGKPVPGVQVKLSPEGEIWIQGPNVTPGYYQDPQLTQESFEYGWFKSDDGGEIDRDGFLKVFGRRKYMILGPSGENVFPEDIEAELNKIKGVIDSAVVGLEADGRMAIHAVLLSQNPDGDAIVAEANRHLASHQQIMEWSLWPEADFPRSATRKVKKDEVLQWLKTRRTETGAPSPAATTSFTRILSQVTEQNPQSIRPDTRIVPELHLDSLLRIELVSRIEEELDVTIDERLITPQTTVAELEALVAERRGKAPAVPPFPTWMLSLPVRALRRLLQPLVCFSWAAPYVRLRRTGLENLSGLRGPVLFMPNHRSYLDSLVALWGIPPKFRSRLAIAAAIDPLYKYFPRLARVTNFFMNTYPFATEAEENIKPSLEYTGRLVDQGWNILIFPEGRMNRTPDPILPFKGGAGVTAVEMQVPVVPMALLGTAGLVPPGKMWFERRGTVEVRFGKPMRFNPAESYPEATRKIEQAMTALLK